jgi:gamma-glutamylcyclotransferase (GGCT)/AIG2-like uncharacterized protein YtfP
MTPWPCLHIPPRLRPIGRAPFNAALLLAPPEPLMGSPKASAPCGSETDSGSGQLQCIIINTISDESSMGKGKIQNDTYISAFTSVWQWAEHRKQLIAGILCGTCKEEDWQEAFAQFLHTRIKTRFLDPIDWILERRQDCGEGFAVVALQCILIEFLEATYQGKIYTTSKQPNPFEYNSSRQLFSDFLLNHKPFSRFFKSKANANGFMLVWFEPNDPRNMRIYRENFYAAVLEFIEAYRIELPSNRELQINFMRKIDDICGIRRVYYFAYGSNMLPTRLIERIEKYHTAFRARLPGYKFMYNKKGVDGTAKANIATDGNAEVCGVCFEIDAEDLKQLSNYEGGYDQRQIVVTNENRDEVRAVTYISASVDNTLRASTEYKGIVLKGAKHWELSEDYIAGYLR